MKRRALTVNEEKRIYNEHREEDLQWMKIRGFTVNDDKRIYSEWW